MATTPTQIRIDSDIKKQATTLFNNLGLDMSSAVNLFLHQCILHRGLPFHVEMPRPSYSQHTLDAMEEARRISCDSDVKGYDSMEELKKALVPLYSQEEAVDQYVISKQFESEIKSAVQACHDFGKTIAEAVSYLTKRFGFSETRSQKEVEKYWDL